MRTDALGTNYKGTGVLYLSNFAAEVKGHFDGFVGDRCGFVGVRPGI